MVVACKLYLAGGGCQLVDCQLFVPHGARYVQASAANKLGMPYAESIVSLSSDLDVRDSIAFSRACYDKLVTLLTLRALAG